MEESRGVRRPAPASHYYYRRELGLRDLLPAVGVGVAVGLAAFYVARLLAARTPLEGDRDARARRSPGGTGREPTSGRARA